MHEVGRRFAGRLRKLHTCQLAYKDSSVIQKSGDKKKNLINIFLSHAQVVFSLKAK